MIIIKRNRAFFAVLIVTMGLNLISCQTNENKIEPEIELNSSYDSLTNMSMTFLGEDKVREDDSKTEISTENVYDNELENWRAIYEDYRYVINEISPSLDSQSAESIVLDIDKKVITAIDMFNFPLLDEYIHPTKGVRVSCFNEASTTDVVLYKGNFTKDSVYTWGYEWGSGNVIEMSVAEIFEKEIYAREYIKHQPIYNPYKLKAYIDGNEYVFYDKCISVLYLF